MDTKTDQKPKPRHDSKKELERVAKYGDGCYVHDMASAARAQAIKDKMSTQDFVKLMQVVSDYAYADFEFRDMLDIFFRCIPLITNQGQSIALQGVGTIKPRVTLGREFENPVAGKYKTEDSLSWSLKINDRYKAWIKTVNPKDYKTALAETEIYEVAFKGLREKKNQTLFRKKRQSVAERKAKESEENNDAE